jgi:arsenite methyltransferase
MSIQPIVQSHYAACATSGLSSANDGVRAVAEAFGYTPNELAAIPDEANLGLSCGNPTAFASLRPGETVVDLGCGGGLDVFLAARRVGPSGRAIGIDMTPEMLALARKNTARSGLTNVEFHQATIDRLPLASGTVDCVISNCVINLAPDKPAVFREIARVLKPGGRVALSDIALKQPLPDELAGDLAAYVGCIAGAILIDDYRAGLVAAGLSAVDVVDSRADLNAYALIDGQNGCCSPEKSEPAVLPQVSSACCAPSGAASVHEGLSALLARYDVNDYAASVKVFALKPAVSIEPTASGSARLVAG